MNDSDMFNSLGTVGEANDILDEKLAALGDRADLHELRDIFERHGVSDDIGIGMLHRHFDIQPGERVVEFGNVSTPWMVADEERLNGGRIVPRSWRFLDGKLRAYEYGFNHPGQQDYSEADLPPAFVHEVGAFLTEASLDGVLGLNSIGGQDTGRIELNGGRVNFTVPAVGLPVTADGEVDYAAEHRPTVWSFGCTKGLGDTKMKLARACLWCPKRNC